MLPPRLVVIGSIEIFPGSVFFSSKVQQSTMTPPSGFDASGFLGFWFFPRGVPWSESS